MYKCIDISKHQTAFNSALAKAKEIDTIICRVAYASTKDTKFDEYISAAISGGYNVGVYGFATWHYKDVCGGNLDTARSYMCSQVNAWLNFAKQYKINSWFAIDQELERGHEMGLSNSDNVTLLNEAAAIIKKAGYEPCVYTGASWCMIHIDLNKMGYPLWIAYYKWYGTKKDFGNVSEEFPANSGTYGKWMNKHKEQICMWQFTSEGYADTYGLTHASNGLDKNFMYYKPDESKIDTTPAITTTTYQKCLFPMKYLRVTQGYGIAVDGVAANTYSHLGTNAIDLAGKDGGKDYVYAPFDCIVKRVYNGTKANSKCNFTWFESLTPVQRLDGKITYLTFQTAHCDDADVAALGIKIGAIFKQGSVCGREGVAGASANHLHCAMSEGKFTGTGWTAQSTGNWCVNNPVYLHKVCWLPMDVQILNDGGYKWTYEGAGATTTEVQTAKTEGTKDTSPTYFKKYSGTSGSIVAALTNIGENSSYWYRTEIADSNGISNYSGTVSQNTQMLYLLKQGKLIKPNSVKYFQKYTGVSVSIVAALKAIGESGDYDYRCKIATVNGFKNYNGSVTDNLAMLALLKKGKLAKP